MALSIRWVTKLSSAYDSPPLTEYALLVLLALLWGVSYSLIKIALVSFPPVTLMAIRVSIAAVILTIVVLRAGHQFPSDLNTWRALLLQAFFNSIGAWTVLAWGQQYVDSGLAGVLNSTSPVFVFFMTLLWTRHESIDIAKFFGAMLGMVGVILLMGVDTLYGLGREGLAQFAILLGALLYACAAVYGKRFKDLSPATSAAGTMIWASLCLIPIACILDRPWQLTIEYPALLAALILSVFSTAGALLIYFRLVKTIGSMGVASQSYLRSAVAICVGILLLGESLSWSLASGICAVIVGMFFINGGLTAFQKRV